MVGAWRENDSATCDDHVSGRQRSLPSGHFRRVRGFEPSPARCASGHAQGLVLQPEARLLLLNVKIWLGIFAFLAAVALAVCGCRFSFSVVLAPRRSTRPPRPTS